MTANRYTVRAEDGAGGWRVVISDPGGRPVAERACADEDEARLYASTVGQHIAWLSEEQFRRYYRLPDPEGA
ncbi:MAG: hypothetical protein HY658_15120 [Actinobacteria bacterium]|nr:hypothetical protein [Actinomycetota bacterium]